MNLLIVDDEIYAIDGLKLVLDWKANGVTQIFDASTLTQAKEILRSEKIEMLLCDIELAGENGLDLLEWITQQGLCTKTVFLTCHEVFTYAHIALRGGAVDYLLKPATANRLVEAMEKVRLLLAEDAIRTNPMVDLVQQCMVPEEGGEQRIVPRVRDYVMAHIGEDLSRSAIAAAMFLHPDYLGRLLKKETGLSLSEFIVKQRISVASILLRTTQRPVGDISQQVGFNELSYFFKSFKKELGITPREYRAMVSHDAANGGNTLG